MSAIKYVGKSRPILLLFISRQCCPSVGREESFKSLDMKKIPLFPGLELTADLASRNVTAVIAATKDFSGDCPYHLAKARTEFEQMIISALRNHSAVIEFDDHVAPSYCTEAVCDEH